MAVTTSNQYRAVVSEDERWIALCLEEDTEAFGLLVQKYQDRVYSTVLHLVGCEDDARDVVQDAFVRAFEALDAFQHQAAFYTWLYRIAVNTAISFLRRKKPVLSIDSLATGTAWEPAENSDDADPTACAERDEASCQVRAALARLSDEHRTVLVLREFEGQTYEEIAAVLECPLGTVRSRLFRARMELRGLLKHLWQEEELTR